MPIDTKGYKRLTAKDLCPEGILLLKGAILARAAEDWRRAVAVQKSGNTMFEFRHSRAEVESFFFVGLVLSLDRAKRSIRSKATKKGD